MNLYTAGRTWSLLDDYKERRQAVDDGFWSYLEIKDLSQFDKILKWYIGTYIL